jgi:hypothetical protein
MVPVTVWEVDIDRCVQDFVANGGIAENAICGSEYNTSRIA